MRVALNQRGNVPLGTIVRFETPQELGAAVRAARNRQGLRLEDLALAAGVGIRFLSEFERGKPTVQLDEALRVVAAVGLELHVDARDR